MTWLRKKRLFSAASMMLLIVIVASCSGGVGSSNLEVELINSGGDMENVKVVSGAFATVLGHIGGGDFRRFSFTPEQDSDIAIFYMNRSGKRFSKKCDIYLEKSTVGTLQIARSPRDDVVWIGVVAGIRTAGIAE